MSYTSIILDDLWNDSKFVTKIRILSTLVLTLDVSAYILFYYEIKRL